MSGCRKSRQNLLTVWTPLDSQASQRSLQHAEELQPDRAQLRSESGVNIGFILRLPEIRLVRADEHTPSREASGAELAAEFEIVLQVDRVLHHPSVRRAGFAMHPIKRAADAA